MRIGVPNASLHCSVTGEGPPLLFVHGFPLSGAMWQAAVARLGPAWRCIVPDLRGHGQSDATPAVTISDLADDLAAVLDQAGEPRPVVLCGLSLGGIIAFEFFRRFRPRLAALVLCNTRAQAEPPEGVARRAALAETALATGTAAAIAPLQDALFSPHTAAATRAEWAALMARTPPLGVAATARALAGRPDSTPTLARIDCPTLVVAGSDDALTPPTLLRDLQAQIRGAAYAEIPRAGHLPPVEQPDAFVAALRAFLNSVPRGD
jgi:3-oxoadipate enol-lactonase